MQRPRLGRGWGRGGARPAVGARESTSWRSRVVLSPRPKTVAGRFPPRLYMPPRHLHLPVYRRRR
jgi:hypothetical protein